MLREMRLALCLAVAALPIAAAHGYSGADEGGEEEKRLTIGDEGPKLEIAHWIKGDAIEGFREDAVYVVEFWATWCGPCLAAMPHVSKLQQQYKEYGVTVIGISDEPLQTVVEFLTRERTEGELWYQTIQYTLATDPERRPHTEYMMAAGQRGIPTAFIVGKSGEVEWIGHPMNMDEPLEKIVHDTWDREAYREEFMVQQERDREMMTLVRAMRQHRNEQNWEEVLNSLDQLLEFDESGFYAAQRFLTLLRDMNDADRAYRYGRKLMDQHWESAGMLNHLAWVVATYDDIDSRDLEFAMTAAQRANELTKSSDASILDTVARVYFEEGDLVRAVKWQRKSVDAAGDVPYADDLKATLKRYEAGLATMD